MGLHQYIERQTPNLPFAKWFLITLSSQIPMPVSASAIFARGIRAALADSAAFEIFDLLVVNYM